MVIKSFRWLEISFPVDGSCDSELSIKGLETSVLSEGIKHRARAAPASMGDNLDSPNSDDDSDSSSNSDRDDLFGSNLIAAAAAIGTGSKSLPIIARSNQPIPAAQTIDSDDSGSDTLLQTAIRGNRRGRPRGRGRERGQGPGSGDAPPLAASRSLTVRNPPMASDSATVSDCQPVLGRRSGRLAGVQRQYVVAGLFPSLTDMEDEDDGVEFCWRDEDGL